MNNTPPFNSSNTLNNTDRAEILCNEARLKNYVRTDRMFAVLLLVQWFVAMIFAFVVSPRSWAGSDMTGSEHLFAALLVGGALTLVPCFLVWKMPGSVLTRHVIAFCQLAYSGLLIHLTGGRIETHFHIFGSLAFLAFYRDWPVLITATLVTALDHLFRGTFFPQSMFGIQTMSHGHAMMMTAHLGRVIEHASYVIFEDIFLILGCLTNVKEMRQTAAKQVEVELVNSAIEQEKVGIERRIESAIKDSEVQKQFLSESVSKMLQKMEQFADGDLRVRLEKGKDGEIGRLFEGFNQAVENTGRLLWQVTEAVNTVADAANQISSSTEELQATTQQQSNQARRVTSEVGQMATASTEGARIGRLTAEAAAESGETAKQGQSIVVQSSSKMTRIAEVVRTSAQTVEQLGQSSEEIGKIVSVIDDIADTTNLLALNAAIEAARAGQHGLGFAVVADEVRQLAERTREATSQIYEMITSVQAETGRAVKAMTVGTGEVDEGIALSQRTAEALSHIVEKTQGMIERVNEIAGVCDQQANSNLRVSESVEQISEVSLRSAEGVAQITGAASRLTELTEQLRSLTSRFKVDASPADELEMWSESGSMFKTEHRLTAY